MSKTAAAWKAQPVFVSSTFRDMQTERDHLRNLVFPLLEERLREALIPVHLETIDLRQGVDTTAVPDEGAREALVLKVCLDEIKRSRPFLIVLMGDRYGWVPPAERMAAAAQEEGFQADLTGKSVTALEIEFGILKEDPEQQRRSFFFFRHRLPCRDPDFNDEFSSNPTECAGHDKLVLLKTRIADDEELGPRVHPYQADWDPAARRVLLEEGWAAWVADVIWPDLYEETRALAVQAPPTPEEAERQALVEFVEHRSRGFVGREELTGHLLDMARGDEPQARVGACVTGEPGLGKSALFAHLYRGLTVPPPPQDPAPPLLILANAAGISAQSASVDAMLRRWIQDLADFLQTANPLPEKATEEDVDNAFYSLLNRVSQQRRVVVLIDALNQFESTVRARHLTWFKPSRWPAGARLIATSLPCPAAEILGQTEGVEQLELPSLTEVDAEAIAHNVWKRYHRQFNPKVYRALVEKRTPDGDSSAGNPLWLNLALEQMNLLDADDFARADREFKGSPGERLKAMQVDVARRLPAEVEGLFDWMLAYAEKVHGAGWARAYATAITLSRFGWRESDLLALVPKLAPLVSPGWMETEYDPLRLASLRRSFRGQVVKRGDLEQWDFFHAQMRASVLRRCVENNATDKKLHCLIADHLLGLPIYDPMRANEAMYHLMEADDKPRAAQFYATVDNASSATETLAWRILAAETESLAAVDWVIGLLGQPGLAPAQVAEICSRFQYDLNAALALTGCLLQRRLLLEAGKDAGERLMANDPENSDWQRQLLVSRQRLGDVLRAQGDLAGAKQQYLEEMAIAESLAEADPRNEIWQRDLSISHERLGRVLRSQGDLAGALREFQVSLQILERLAAVDPSNADWQRDLSTFHIRLGDVMKTQGDLTGALREYRASLQGSERVATADPSNADWQWDLSIVHNRLGDVLYAQGDLAGALREYRAILQVRERVAAADPSNADWQRDLSISHENIGGVLLAQGDLAGALREYRASSQVRERLAAADPSNAVWQRDLSVIHNKLGIVLQDQGDLAAALREFRACSQILERLAASDPINAERQRDLSVSHSRLGYALQAHGDLATSTHEYQASLQIAERLAAADSSNAVRQRDLAAIRNMLGDVLLAQGDLAGALQEFQASLQVSERLVATDPSNAHWQYDLGISNERLGSVYQVMEQLDEALLKYHQKLDIITQLAAADPSNAKWQRDLSVSHNKLGDVLRAQGDLAGALQEYRVSLQICERLAAADPSNAGWQRDLFVSYWDMAEISEQTEKGDAMTWWRQAYEQLSGMKQQGIMLPKDEKYLAQLKSIVGGSKGDGS